MGYYEDQLKRLKTRQVTFQLVDGQGNKTNWLDLNTDSLNALKGLLSDNVFTVWVGGIEVNSHLITEAEALELASSFKSKGYDDVIIERVG